MKAGKIIRIFDKYRVAFDLGLVDGVREGARFGIYTPEDEVLDPATGESLGSYRRRKVILVAQEVFEKFTVAMPPTRRETVEPEQRNTPLGTVFGTQPSPRYRMVRDRLPVREEEVEPLPSDSGIGLGDLVLPLDENDEPIPTAPDAASPE